MDGTIKTPSHDILNERDIVPSFASHNLFVKSFSNALARFLKTAFHISLARLIEEERLNQDVRSLQDVIEPLLGIPTNTKDDSDLRKRAELLGLISAFVERFRTSRDRKIVKDFAPKAVSHLLDSLVSVSLDSSQNQTKKRSVMDALATISALDWQMAVMAVAIRTSKFTNSKLPLEFRTILVEDDEQVSQTFSSKSGPRIGLYSFAMEVLNQWIESTRKGCDMLRQPQQSNKSSNTLRNDPTFAEIVLQLLTMPGALQDSIRTITCKVLVIYAEKCVAESPSGATVVANEEKQWIKRAGRAKQKNQASMSSRMLSEDSEIALIYGLSAISVITLAAKAGYYYGYNRQLNMFKSHESKTKERALQRVMDEFSQKISSQTLERQNELLTQFGRLMASSSSPNAQMMSAGVPTQQLPAAPTASPQSFNMPQTQSGFLAAPPISSINNQAPNSFAQPNQYSTHPPMPTNSNGYAPSAGHQGTSGPTHFNQAPATTHQSVHQPPPQRYPPLTFGDMPRPNAPSFPYPSSQDARQQQAPAKHVSFATSYLKSGSSSSSGYTSPPPPNQAVRTNGVSPMTQDWSRRKPVSGYEDSSGEDESDSMASSDSSDGSFGSSDSDFDDTE